MARPTPRPQQPHSPLAILSLRINACMDGSGTSSRRTRASSTRATSASTRSAPTAISGRYSPTPSAGCPPRRSRCSREGRRATLPWHPPPHRAYFGAISARSRRDLGSTLSQAISDIPDVIDDYFELCSKILRKCPPLILESGDVFTAAFQCGCAALHIQHREVRPPT